MADDDLLVTDALGQADAIARRAVSALELVDAYLDRIERLNPRLAAFVALDAEGARRAAREADAAGPDPGRPFLGLALSIKDVEDVAGLATTESCRVLADNVAAHDGPVTRRFRNGGFAIVGKTNVPEFCTDMTVSSMHGVCRNPWDLSHTPGGSSGGAAAALAAGLCAASHGTDGAGSVRIPASFCALVGVKPTRGLVSFGPEEGPAYFGTTVPGVLTRSVRDAAAMLDVLAAPGPWTPWRAQPFAAARAVSPGPLRIAVCTSAPLGRAEPECQAAAEAAAAVLESLGHHVEAATPDWGAIMAVAAGPMSVPGPAALVPEERIGEVEPRNRPVLAGLGALRVVDHARWVEEVRAASARFCSFFDRFDVLVTPTVGRVAPGVTWSPWDQGPEEHMARFAEFPSFAQPFNLSGQPAVSLPLAWSDEGLPIGVQLAGRRLAEATLLQVAAQLEEASPWARRQASVALGL